MPSHKIHLKIAMEINKRLNLNLDLLMLGSVLPDLNLENHRDSHYQTIGQGYPKYLANPDLFIKNNVIDNTISLGYLLHILTDRYYNEFIYRKYFIWEQSLEFASIQPKALVLNNGQLIYNRKEFRNYKQHDFWEYDVFLIKTKQLIKFKNYDCLNYLPNFSNATFDKLFLSQYIDRANAHIDNNSLQIPDKYKNIDGIYLQGYQFTNSQELDKLLQDCIIYILNYLENKKIIFNNKFDKIVQFNQKALNSK